MWILRESQYPGLRLRHTQICVVLALCWNVVLACFGILFPCYSPWQRKRLNPCLASKCINSPMQDFARLCKTLQDIQVESLGQERNHSQAPRHPHQSRHRWRLPVMHPEDHKWCRWHRSRPVRTRVSVSHLRHVLIYIYIHVQHLPIWSQYKTDQTVLTSRIKWIVWAHAALGITMSQRR
jgi:hypothetical protein